MPKHRRVSKVYTSAQRAAIVGEIQQRQRSESRSVEYLARQFGISDKTYYNWLRAGVRAPDSVPAGKAPAVRAKAARRYDEAERSALMAEIARRREAGQRLGAILHVLDLGRTSYVRWLNQAPSTPAFRAVTVHVAPAVASQGVTAMALVPAAPIEPAITPAVPADLKPLTLVAPGGYRIEGLAVETAAALLRALT